MEPSQRPPVVVTVSIDTEEDNWGTYAQTGATTRNIAHLPELQERFARWGARPTYLVNRPPLMSRESVEVLGRLGADPAVEIGAHCHPWNTPPSTGEGPERSMMCALPLEANRAKIADITGKLRTELGVRATSFRAGRWGFGPSVAGALVEEGYLVDSSVTPFVDWSVDGGPDYSDAPTQPYRFDPARPFVPDPAGSLVEVPTTVGFLRGNHRGRSRIRRAIERGPLRFMAIGALEGLGLLQRRWLSPEQATAGEMVRLADACVAEGARVLDMTFHSCTLLPGATPFVRDDDDRGRFLDSIDSFLRHCIDNRFVFRRLGELAQMIPAKAL